MNRPIRIGLIAEGQTELGASIPYIKPEDGGKVIPRQKEGALHTLIRREIQSAGFLDCDFIQRHPSSREVSKGKVTTGYGFLKNKTNTKTKTNYLSQTVIAWKPEEVDMIVIVVDADDILNERQRDLELALDTIRSNHLDANNKEILDRSAGGLAIRNFETWLLADTQSISDFLGVAIAKLENLEDLENTKEILENAIANSSYLTEQTNNQRPLQIRWNLANHIDMATIKTYCPNGYAVFTQNLIAAAKAVYLA